MRKQVARFVADLERAERVAGVVVGDGRIERTRLRGQSLRSQELRHLPHGELGSGSELLVGHHVGRASGGVHDHDVRVPEDVTRALGQALRDREPAVVRSERATARLPARHHDAPAVPRKHPDRCEVHRVEPPVLHAAREQRDGAAGLDPLRWLGHARESRERVSRAGTSARAALGMNGRAIGCNAAATRTRDG